MEKPTRRVNDIKNLMRLLTYLVAYLGLCGEYGSVDLGRDDDDRGRHLTIRLVI
jgi:hypothetical protein